MSMDHIRFERDEMLYPIEFKKLHPNDRAYFELIEDNPTQQRNEVTDLPSFDINNINEMMGGGFSPTDFGSNDSSSSNDGVDFGGGDFGGAGSGGEW
jgi:uncharacterized membrane protein YgcG